MQIHKIVLTVIDFDKVGSDGVRVTLENAHYPNRCISPHVVSVETREIGEWRDDHPLNNADTYLSEVERVFATPKTTP